MPSPSPPPPFIDQRLHQSPLQGQDQAQVTWAHGASASTQEPSATSLPDVAMSSEEEVRAPPSPSSSAQPKPQGQPLAAAVATLGGSTLAEPALAPSFLSPTPPTLAPHQPLHAESGRPPDKAQGQPSAGPNRCNWSPASASTTSRSTTSLTVSSSHDDMQLDPPSPGLGIVAAFMAGASASASRPSPRPQTTQPLFTPTAGIAQGSINLAPYAEPPRSFPGKTSSVSPSGNVQRLRREHRWTRAEDLALLASIKQHGEDWKLASIDVSKEGGPLRTPAATYKRYERLKKHAAKAASKLTSATLEATAVSSTLTDAGQHQHQHRKQPAVSSSSSKPDAPSGSLLERWTREEDETLIALRQSCEQVKDVWPAFCKHFPGTKRTASAVQSRWTQTLRPKQEIENEQRNDTAAAGAASKSPTRLSGRATPSLQSRAPSHTATSPALSAIEGSVAESQLPSPAGTTAAAAQPPSPPFKYSIEYLPQGGFAIWHLPPHHEVHILSQTICQIVQPEGASSFPRIKSEDQDEERPMLAPFAFRMSAEGFIQPLSLPAGTETDISFLEDGAVMEEEEEEEERGGSEQAGIVETQFTALDNYVVVFRNRVSG